MGDTSAPYILDSTVVGCKARGAYFLIGVDALVNGTDFLNNGVDGAFVDDAGVTSVTANNTFNSCTFEGNDHGFGLGNGAAAYLYDCEINSNVYSGVRDYLEAGGPTAAEFHRCDIIDNGEYGVNMTVTTSNSIFFMCDISGNTVHAAHLNGNSGTTFLMSELATSSDYNMWLNASSADIISCDIYDGPTGATGGIRATNGSAPNIYMTTIRETHMGVLSSGSSPTFNQVNIRNCDTGTWLGDSSTPNIISGNIENNGIGVYVYSDDIDLMGLNITDNTNLGIYVRESERTGIWYCDLDGNDIGVQVNGGDWTMFRNTTVFDSSSTGIHLTNGANITTWGTTFGSNGEDLKLDMASTANCYSAGIPYTAVTMMDANSMFNHYWRVSLEV
jgi:hypothetical protein